MIATIINFLRNLFNRNKGTITGSISGAIANAQSVAKQTPSKVDLGPQIVKQSSLENDQAHYACNLTSHLMMGYVLGGPKITLTQYYNKCLETGAIRPDCFILDYSKVIQASGLSGYKFTSCPVDANKMVQLLQSGTPLHVFAENHFEMVRGFEYTPQGELLFIVNDPGYQNDTHIEPSTWRLFRTDANGNRIYSVKGKDGTRYCKSIGYYVKTK
jgi:hypothetical protein